MKFSYFKIKDAFDDARDSFAYGSGTEKLSSTAKLIGKSAANIGMLAVEIGTEMAKGVPEFVGKEAQKNLDKNRGSMSEEQIEKAEQVIARADEARDRRLAKEREDREKNSADNI